MYEQPTYNNTQLHNAKRNYQDVKYSDIDYDEGCYKTITISLRADQSMSL